MATFSQVPIMTIQQPFGNFFDFTVSYTIRYTEEELAFPEGFVETLFFRENDDQEPFGGDDDTYGVVQPVFFRPQSRMETRTFKFSRTAAALDTESGGEEVYATVGHRRNIDGLNFNFRNTGIFPLAV
ncbi:hypothetical protein ACFCYC_18800 [Streptomyces sp. NPDC056402]|uniref:hypothetical protein n=1 Tax=Streptomyces sp. NPDC056402 TaxID=3345810 RepID=UPI0035D5BC0B